MNEQRIGIIHPGAMGVSIAAAAQRSGHHVVWASEGRSAATRARAAQHSFEDVGTVARLCEACGYIISVCPPHSAEDVADEVLSAGFRGHYLDANAIAPQRAIRIGDEMQQAGITFVDGGIIGGPAWQPGTLLYLSGEHTRDFAACFAAGPLETREIGPTLGRASALKMCYAAYTKGSTALLCAVVAAAEGYNVRAELFEQWAGEDPDKVEREVRRVRGVTAKAWRFVGEMEEIAATFRATGLPGEFHDAAALLYGRMAPFKDAADTPALDDVLAALLDDPRRDTQGRE